MGENGGDSLTGQVLGKLPMSLFLLISRTAKQRVFAIVPVKSSKAGKGELFSWWEEAELWRCCLARQSLKTSDSSIVWT